MQFVNKEKLIEILKTVNHATPVSMITETVPDMNKTNNPFFGKVKKVTKINGFICFTYQNSVNRQREKEESTTDFVPKPRKWGERIKGTPLVFHKDNYYLEVRLTKFNKPYYYSGDQEVDLTPYLKAKAPNYTHQGLDPEHEVVVRDFSIENIHSIKMNKEEYVVIK